MSAEQRNTSMVHNVPMGGKKNGNNVDKDGYEQVLSRKSDANRKAQEKVKSSVSITKPITGVSQLAPHNTPNVAGKSSTQPPPKTQTSAAKPNSDHHQFQPSPGLSTHIPASAPKRPVHSSNSADAPGLAAKKGGTGFNFGRAINGLSKHKPAVKQPQKLSATTLQPAAKQPTTPCSNRFEALNSLNVDDDPKVQPESSTCAPAQMETTRFSVLNVEASFKSNKLVGEPMDLYPHSNGNEEMCTMNQQSPIDMGRILPAWSQFKPSDSLNRILNKDYGITDAQKKRILDALQSKNQAVKAEDQEEWVDGEWEYFHDKCMELDLDPDFCVEDVYEDDSGSAQFISQLAKTGKYFDPVVVKPTKR